MRKALLVCLLACATFSAHADDASKQAKVEEYFKLAKIDQLTAQTMNLAAKQMNAAMVGQMMGVTLTPEQQKQMNAVQERLMQLLQKTIGWEALEPEYVKLFANEQLDALITFYRSPAGQAMVEKTPELLQQSNAIVQGRMQSVMPELQQIVKSSMSQASQTTPK